MSMIGRRVVAAAPPRLAGRVICWQSLDDSITGQHAPVDREVPAHHEGTHRCVLLGQGVGFVGKIRLVLAAIDEH